MELFLRRHQYLIIWVLSLIIIGSLATVIVQMNSYIPPSQPTFPSSPNSAPGSVPIVISATPSVTLTLQQQGKNKDLLIHWKNLPAGTTALGIFRKLAGTTSTGQLVTIINIFSDQLGDGNSLYNLGTTNETGYSFFAEAFGDGGSGGGFGNGENGSSSATSTVIWTSDTLIPNPATSTPTSTNPGGGGGTGGGGQPQQPTSTNSTTTPNNNPTSTNPGDNGNGNGSGPGGSGSTTTPSSTGGGNGPGGNTAIYYTPQIQGISGSPDHGSFWVQHAGQSIDISWQGLPSDATDIAITRSESSTGPWDQILAEKNPSVNGSSSIQLVDGTVGDPYYYELTAFSGTTTLGTFGPDYLPPVGQ